MARKPNGSGEEEKKLIRFPTLVERDRMRKERESQEKQWRKEYKSGRGPTAVPFFNLSRIPPFTATILVVFLAVHAGVQLLLRPETILQIYFNFGFIPGAYTGGVYKPLLFLLISPVTYLFLHGGWMHLFFNGTMMLSLGLFFEKRFGTRQAILFFFICGLGSALFYFALNPFSQVPVIGASGSLSGYFGALIIVLSQSGIGGPFAGRGPWRLIAFWLLFMILTGSIGGESIAWQSHVGGFLTGIVFLKIMGRRI